MFLCFVIFDEVVCIGSWGVYIGGPEEEGSCMLTLGSLVCGTNIDD